MLVIFIWIVFIGLEIIVIIQVNILLPRRKKKNVVELMKDELGWKIMTEFAGLKLKPYYYLTDENDKK